MPKQKRDYKALKKEFMASKCWEVKVFFEWKYGSWSWNWTICKNTKWWAKEKKELSIKSTDKAMKQIENKLAKQLEPSTEFLLGNITKAIELSAVKLQQMAEKGNINVKDLSTIRWMNRIQNNQPTTYVKSENENIEKIQWIHIVIWQNPSDKWENNTPKEI